MILFGEDVAIAGGVFAVTPGLYEKYGPDARLRHADLRARDVGRRLRRRDHRARPVLEIMFGDFLALSMDMLINQATKYWFLSGGTRAARS